MLSRQRIKKYVGLVKGKADEILVKGMGFSKAKLVWNKYECYLAYDSPKPMKTGCVTVDIYQGEVDSCCPDDLPREQFLIADVSYRLGGRYARTYRRRCWA